MKGLSLHKLNWNQWSPEKDIHKSHLVTAETNTTADFPNSSANFTNGSTTTKADQCFLLEQYRHFQ